jgi:hypothetical protein
MGTFRVCATVFLVACGPSASVPDFDARPGGRPDAPTECPPTPPPTCDVFLSCGCDPGQKCSSGQSSLECVAAGAKLAGEACAGDDECVPGTVCLSYGGPIICRVFCDDLHPCTADEACYVGVNDRSMTHIVAAICGPTCILLAQDCTIAGQSCYPSPDVYPVAEKGTCRPSGAGVQGETCATSSDCATGYVCIKPNGICAKMCARPDGVPACEPQTTCHALSGHTRTGICQNP